LIVFGILLSDDDPAGQGKRTPETVIWHMPNDREHSFLSSGKIGKLQALDHGLPRPPQAFPLSDETPHQAA
jgi:hypothetical protein